MSGFVLILSAVYLYYKEYKLKGLINLKGIFLLSFIGGQGLSVLKLSYLQKEWEVKTWICFFLVIIVFNYTYEYIFTNFKGFLIKSEYKFMKYRFIKTDNKNINRKLFNIIVFIAVISTASFIVEALVLGYIPIFIRGVPHAYSYFHISGLHYFTVLFVFNLSLGLAYINDKKIINVTNIKDIVVVLCMFFSLVLPILLVSRFQFLLSCFLAIIFTLLLNKKIKKIYILGIFFSILCVYVIITFARSHSIAYLNEIFEMKKNYPIFISQPYIYIANNYDNFNEMVANIKNHSWGFKSIFPFFALTGLKFKFAHLFSYPLFVTKTELTTLTIIYDAYYDFGIFGVILFSFFLGVLSAVLESIKTKNYIYYLIYAQIYIYFMFSFFTTWFSNPTTWFYLVISLCMYVYMSYNLIKIRK